MNDQWYLIVGYIGEFEVYNEDGSKKYFTHPSSDFDVQATRIQSASYLSSCAAYSTSDEMSSLIIGTSLGEIFKFKVTMSNSFIHINKFEYASEADKDL